jgi:hypothetical protein
MHQASEHHAKQAGDFGVSTVCIILWEYPFLNRALVVEPAIMHQGNAFSDD